MLQRYTCKTMYNESLFLCPQIPTCSDRFRTTVNVLGDSFGVGIVQHYSRKQLSHDPPPPPTTPESTGSTPPHQRSNYGVLCDSIIISLAITGTTYVRCYNGVLCLYDSIITAL